MATIGLDIGGTHLRAARVGADGTVLARARDASDRDPGTVLARCLRLIDAVRDDSVTAVGIGVPGQVIAEERRVLSGGYVDLSGLPFAERVQTATGLPVTIENDAAMALLAEAAHGAARGLRSAVMLTIGTGIGGAVLEGGRLLRGRGTAGQLGHLVVVPDGAPCVCGNRGCVEVYSAGTAFGQHLRAAGLPPDTRAEDLLARDDAAARGVIAAWAQPLRAAIDSLIAALAPEAVVIGGGAGAAMLAALERFPARPSWFSAPVVAAELGDDAGVIGAAVAARPAPKRLVLVNGVPASGKSGVAAALSARLGWPVLSLDTVKAPFLTELAPVDRPQNRVLGRASLNAMFDLVAAAPAGSGFVLDAWFGFQPPEVVQAALDRVGPVLLAEVWCDAPAQVIGARYGARVEARGPGHPGREYVPELIALAGRAAPTGMAPVLRVDTTVPFDAGAAVAWLAGRGLG